jgi:hypothetical protein
MKKSTVLHPFLFAIFPVLFLFAHNIEHSLLNEILLPIALTLAFALLSWSLLSAILKNKEKAGLLVSLVLLLFFSYGHFYDAMESLDWMVMLGRHKILFAVWGVLLALGVYFSIKTRRDLQNFTSLLNAIAALLVVISLVNIGAYELRTKQTRQDSGSAESAEANPIHLESAAALPDIFYIILDGYAREDILQGIYGYENAEFTDYLTQKGFYVADKSRANYSQTSLSLASSLNLAYLDDLIDQVGIESDDRVLLEEMLTHNNVRRFLKQYGYTFVAFSSGYSATEMRNADVYMTPGWALSEFQNVLINTTPIPVLLNNLPNQSQHDLHRDRLLYIFDHLADPMEMSSPVFVFAHIIAPHPPFVFGERGEPIKPGGNFSLADGAQYADLTPDEYVENYTRQLIFVNKKAQEAINDILSTSPEPPIIILQADHGPGSMLDLENPDEAALKERMSILNAYYLPDSDYEQLYDGITPVNTFRVIFNRYFGTDHELLQDQCYFSGWFHPYNLVNVTKDTE